MVSKEDSVCCINERTARKRIQSGNLINGSANMRRRKTVKTPLSSNIDEDATKTDVTDVEVQKKAARREAVDIFSKLLKS